MIKFDKKYIDGLREALSGLQFDKWLGSKWVILATIDDSNPIIFDNKEDHEFYVLDQILGILTKQPETKFVQFDKRGFVIPVDIDNMTINSLLVLNINTPKIMSLVRDIKLDQIL